MPRGSELALIERARKGHGDAFRELVEAYKDRLFAFVWRMVRNHHEAEDLCQSAFVKAYESLNSYSREYAFSTWLFTIAYRLCLNHLRKRRPVAADIDFARFSDGDEDGPAAVANSEEARRLRDLIWTAVDQLSAAQKACVLMFYRENQSCQEIAEVLGIPAVTVKSHLHRAREKLARQLRAELVDDWMAIRYLSDTHFA
jgi:RNA polymerase sigma-70 factor (ECF subfamily)